MLKFFSRMERTRNVVLLIFAVIMVVSLIVFYAPSDTGVQNSLTRSDETVARVGSEKITVGEMATMMQARGGSLPPKFLLNNQLISQRIMRVEADRLGLVASDAEVADYIRKNFKPQDGRPFDQNRYEQMAVSNAGSVSAFEQSIRDTLSAQKLEAFITSGVTVSEEEVLKDFQRRNTKFDLSYVPVNVSDLAQTIKPSDEELQNYFNQNKAKYHIDVPQKKIRYLFVNTSKLGEKLSISDEDLRAEYEKIPAERRTKGVEGQEIVLRVPRPEDDARVLEKANQLVTQARKDGGKISAQAFADMAKGHSENPATAQNGGKLSGPVKENPAKPDDPYQQLLKMQPGEVTEPINYQGRYFILRRGETIPKTFEDAKQELLPSLRNRRADTIALQLTQRANDRLKEVKDVQKVADEFAKEANMSPSEMVRETGYLKPGDDIPNVGVSPDFEQGISGLQNPNDVGDKFRIKDGFAIPLLVDQKPARDAEFADVKNKVAEDFKLEQARVRLEEIAKQIAGGANGAADLAKAAEAKGLKAQEQKTFILGSPLGTGPSAATSEALEDAVFNLKPGEVTKTPVKVNDNWYIVGVTKREDAKTEDFAKQRDQLVETMMQQKRAQIFNDYLAAKRREMEAAKKIEIYPEPMKKLEEFAATQEPAMPQLPQGFQIPQQ